MRAYPTLVLSVAVGLLTCIAAPQGQPARGQAASAAALAPVPVEAQPLAANVQRVVEALDYLGAPWPADRRADLARAGQARDAKRLQELLDPHVLLTVHINRSEERRVGKEWRSRWSPYHKKKK